MTLRLQIASDLHLEHLVRVMPGQTLITPAPDADALVLAGDIGSGEQAIRMFKDWPVPVFYVAGNHEFYRRDWTETLRNIREVAAGTRVKFLERDESIFKRVRILGATLWTNYTLSPTLSQQVQMQEAGRQLSDHRVIAHGHNVFTPADALANHQGSHAWLLERMALPFEGKTVVISHHAPHPHSVAPRWEGQTLNAAFASNLPELLRGADLWVHGHTHDGFDYPAEGCRVVANPRGYLFNKFAVEKGERPQFENPNFNPHLVVEV